MAVITKTDLENAKLDAKSLEDVVNGTGTVTTRTGRAVKSVSKVISDIEAELDSLAVASVAQKYGHAPGTLVPAHPALLVDSYPAAGSVLVGPDGPDFGLKIPTGQAGTNAYVAFGQEIGNSNGRAGDVITITAKFRTSDHLTDTAPLVVKVGSMVDGVYTYEGKEVTGSIVVLYPSSSSVLVTARYTVQGGASEKPTILLQTTSIVTTGGDRYCYVDELSYNEPDVVIVDLVNEERNVSYVRTVHVKPDGTGDYYTVKAAVDAVGAGLGFYKRHRVFVHEGVYTDREIMIPRFCDVIGVGMLDRIWLKGELADSASPNDGTTASLRHAQTVWLQYTAKLKNLKVTAKNMQYPIHSDNVDGDAETIEVEDCHVEHYGNDGLLAYYVAHGGSAGDVSLGGTFGAGTHSGEHIRFKRTTCIGPQNGFGFHTQKDFAEPCLIEFIDSRAICTTPGGYGMFLQPMGSGRPDRLVIRGSEIRGSIFHTINWASVDPANQPSDQHRELEVHIEGSGPVTWLSDSRTSALLELRSTAGASSAVAVSGTGAIALFGDVPTYIPGGVGYAGRVYSQHTVYSNQDVPVSLGERLGNCTGTAKTLNITFDGAVNRTLTLNADYSGMDNPTVVAALNALLADGTRSFIVSQAYLSNPYDNRAPIFQHDLEVEVTNVDTTTILKGMVVAMSGGQYSGRVALASDAAKVIVGIALDDIVPGARGRVLKRGAHILQPHLLFSGTPSIAFGDEFGVSSTPGVIVESASVPLLRCIELRDAGAVFEIV